MLPRSLAAAVAATMLLACSDASGPNEGLTLARLAGTWNLSQAELLLASDTTVRFDLKAAADLAATLAVASSGDATLVAWVAGEPVDTIYPHLEVRGDTLVYSAPGGGSVFEFKVGLVGRSMTWLALYTDESFDINGDGATDETRERYAWQRQ